MLFDFYAIFKQQQKIAVKIFFKLHIEN